MLLWSSLFNLPLIVVTCCASWRSRSLKPGGDFQTGTNWLLSLSRSASLKDRRAMSSLILSLSASLCETDAVLQSAPSLRRLELGNSLLRCSTASFLCDAWEALCSLSLCCSLTQNSLLSAPSLCAAPSLCDAAPSLCATFRFGYWWKWKWKWNVTLVYE
ncbi:uncharacterized protein LOC126409931 [Nymphaea colorata]|uniref:uncharacterized protein LOC126409931 n=1 Tax=Nymphaea colorata TaxID=210225 RepID=UPI00214EBA26|nr:uncharacterized protein LOC126409931 [Nymphaea colorata]